MSAYFPSFDIICQQLSNFYPKLFTQFNFEKPFNRGFELKRVMEARGQRLLGGFVWKLRRRKSME